MSTWLVSVQGPHSGCWPARSSSFACHSYPFYIILSSVNNGGTCNCV